MKRHAWSMVVIFFTLGILSAGEASPYEKTLQTMIGNLDKIGVTLKTIVDEESADAAKPTLRKEAVIWIEARAKAAKLPPPERDEKTRLEKMYKPKLEEAMRRVFTEVRRVENIPGGKEALKEINGVLKKDGK